MIQKLEGSKIFNKGTVHCFTETMVIFDMFFGQCSFGKFHHLFSREPKKWQEIDRRSHGVVLLRCLLRHSSFYLIPQSLRHFLHTLIYVITAYQLTVNYGLS